MLDSKNESYPVPVPVIVGFLATKPDVSDCFQSHLWPPKSETCSRPGMAVEMAFEVCQIGKIVCDFVLATHSSFDQMAREVSQGRFHASMPVFSPTPLRQNHADFSRSLFTEPTMLFARLPKESTFSRSSMFAFSWRVWLCIGLVLLVLSVFGTINDSLLSGRRSYIRLPKGSGWLLNVLDFLSVFLQQGHPSRRERPHSTLLLLGVWGLCCIALSGIYSGVILVTAVISNRDLPFSNLHSFAACVAAGRCAFASHSSSTAHFAFISRNITDQLRLRSFKFKKLNKPGEAVSATEDIPMFVEYLPISKFSTLAVNYEACTFHGVRIEKDENVFLVQKSLRDLLKRFNDAIETLQTRGIIQQIYRKYVGYYEDKMAHCSANVIGSTPIALRSYASIMMAAVVPGLLVAGLFLAVEKLFYFSLVNRTVRPLPT